MRDISVIGRDIHANWRGIVDHARLAEYATLPQDTIRLLGSSTKVRKGEAHGVETKVVYMSPDREAMLPDDPRTLCGMAGDCSKICLGHSAGLMIQESVRLARLWKTTLLLGNRSLWRELFDAECRAFAVSSIRAGWAPAVRADGGTDTGEGMRAARRASGCSDERDLLQYYDYSKIPSRIGAAALIPRYHLTYSFSERSRMATVAHAIDSGCSVAVVFDVRTATSARAADPLPSEWRGYPLADFDLGDDRFNDVPGSVGGLRFKAAKDKAAGLLSAVRFIQST